MDIEDIRSVDKQNMWDLLKGFPEQWKEAVEITENIDLTIDQGSINTICLAGMGGSAIGADLIRAYSYKTCPHPIQVVRHYEIPAWINENTLFIGCSFSGNTEETLSALEAARQQGAQTVGITSGGQLLLKASRKEFDYIKLPGGMPTRAALGYNFLPLFRIFQYLGYLDEGEDALEETGQFLTEQKDLLSNAKDNEALSLAEELNDTLPVVYSDAATMEPVNLRWRSQFEENAKTLAYGNTLPEMSHNEIVGWEDITHLTGRLSVITLSDREGNERVRQRMQVVDELISDQAASFHRLETRGKSRLTRLFSLIQLADWTSFYLAMLDKVNPTPTAKIDLLKRKLAEV